MKSRVAPSLRKQRGMSLFVALIVLTLMLLLALSGINTGSSGLQVVRNSQTRQEAMAAAVQAAQQTISSAAFTTSTTTQTLSVAVDDRSSATYTAVVAPRCINAEPARTTDLDLSDPNDLSCFGGVGFSGPPICSNTRWDIGVRVQDASNTHVDVTVHQGVGIRVPTVTAQTYC